MEQKQEVTIETLTYRHEDIERIIGLLNQTTLTGINNAKIIATIFDTLNSPMEMKDNG